MKPHVLAAALTAALLLPLAATAAVPADPAPPDPEPASPDPASRDPADTDPANTRTPRTARFDAVQVYARSLPPAPANQLTLEADALRGIRLRSADSARLLERVPGLSLQGAGGTSALPALHGLGGDRVRIQVDGMDSIASCPNHMNPPLSYIDPAKVGAVTVYAGIAPVSAGGDSLGGSIVVQSRAPRFSESGWQSHGELSASHRSNGDAYGASIAVGLADERTSLSYEGSVVQAGNHRAGGAFRTFTATGVQGHDRPTDEVASSAFLVRTHRLGLALRGEQHLLEASFGFQDLPYQLFPNQRMDMLDNRQRRLSLRYLGAFAWGDLEARAWHERVEHAMDFGPDRRYWYGSLSTPPGVSSYGVPCAPIGPGCAAGMPMLTESRSSGVNLHASLALPGGSQLRLGAEWQHYRLDDWWPPSGGGMWPGTFVNINDGRRDREAAYVEWEASLAPAWTVSLGMRHTWLRTRADEVHGYAVSPGSGMSYAQTAADAAAFNASDRSRGDRHLDLVALARHRLSERAALEFGYARKTRSPNLYERYAWSTWAMAAVMNNFVGDGNGYVGDPALRPERADTLSATFTWDGDWHLRATAYATGVHDYIDALALGNNGPERFNVLRYRNQRARLHGLDFSARRTLADASWGRLALDAVASHVRGENRDSGDGLYNLMPLNARVALQHDLGRWRNTLEWVAVARKQHLSAVRNEVPTAGYALLNLQARYQAGAWSVEFGIDNVFDRLYRLPTGGLYVAQGRSMGINAIPFGIAMPGPGRSLNLGLQYAF